MLKVLKASANPEDVPRAPRSVVAPAPGASAVEDSGHLVVGRPHLPTQQGIDGTFVLSRQTAVGATVYTTSRYARTRGGGMALYLYLPTT